MAATAAQVQTTLPPEDLEAMLDLSRFLGQVAEPAALVGPDGQTEGLPAEVHLVAEVAGEAVVADLR